MCLEPGSTRSFSVTIKRPTRFSHKNVCEALKKVELNLPNKETTDNEMNGVLLPIHTYVGLAC